MRALSVATVVLAGCSDEPSSVAITAPAEGSTVTGDVVLTLVGHNLTKSGGSDVYIDTSIYLASAGGSVSSTAPASCDDECTFEIRFAGTNIANGTHAVKVEFIYDLVTIAQDEVSLVFARP